MTAVCADLKTIYSAVDEAQASVALEVFKLKWNKKYPQISKAWEDNHLAFVYYDIAHRETQYTDIKQV